MKNGKRFLFLLCCLLMLCPVPAHGAEAGAVRVAFLDSGVSTKHLDADRVEPGENFVFPGRDTADRVGHGTATAGLVLGSAELDLPGLCPTAAVVPLVCYDVYPAGALAEMDAGTLAAAIYAAVDEYDCKILNISMGTTGDDPVLRRAVEYALGRGALILSAVGNDNLTDPAAVYYPAAYDGVIGVGAASGEGPAAFSQRTGVDILAPGVDLAVATNRNTSRAETRSGTSYACAYASGVCAAIWTAAPELTADEVKDRLFSLARDVGQPGYDRDSGWGIVTAPAGAGETDGRQQRALTAARRAMFLTLWAAGRFPSVI